MNGDGLDGPEPRMIIRDELHDDRDWTQIAGGLVAGPDPDDLTDAERDRMCSCATDPDLECWVHPDREIPG